jgi:hypothetical protein
VGIAAILGQAQRIDIYTTSVDSAFCSKRLTIEERREVRRLAWILSKSKYTWTEIMPCGWDAEIHLKYKHRTEEAQVNRECGYLLNDGLLGNYRRPGRELGAYFARTESEGTGDASCIP